MIWGGWTVWLCLRSFEERVQHRAVVSLQEARNAIWSSMFHWGKWKKRMGANSSSKRPVFDEKEDGKWGKLPLKPFKHYTALRVESWESHVSISTSLINRDLLSDCLSHWLSCVVKLGKFPWIADSCWAAARVPSISLSVFFPEQVEDLASLLSNPQSKTPEMINDIWEANVWHFFVLVNRIEYSWQLLMFSSFYRWKLLHYLLVIWSVSSSVSLFSSVKETVKNYNHQMEMNFYFYQLQWSQTLFKHSEYFWQQLSHWDTAGKRSVHPWMSSAGCLKTLNCMMKTSWRHAWTQCYSGSLVSAWKEVLCKCSQWAQHRGEKCTVSTELSAIINVLTKLQAKLQQMRSFHCRDVVIQCVCVRFVPFST